MSGKSSLVDMRASEFATDPSVQRPLNDARVKHLVKKFNPLMLGLLTATKRPDGRSYILDGQHRVAAAREKHFDGYIATRLFENLTVEEEADLFLQLNDQRKVGALDKFNVRATMGDPAAVALKKALEHFGLKPSMQQSKGQFVAIVALERVYAGFMSYAAEPRIDLVEAVLQILTRAYGTDDRKAFQANTVMGVGLIIHIFGKRVDLEDLTTALRTVTADNLAIRGRSLKDTEGGTGAEGVAKVLLQLYNKGKSSRRLEFHEFKDGIANLRKRDRETYDASIHTPIDGRRTTGDRRKGKPQKRVPGTAFEPQAKTA